MKYQDRLLKVIPGGAHTYSKGFDQFPVNAPQILSHGKGAYVYSEQDAKILDYGMALRAVNIGYAEDEIDSAAIEQIRKGNSLTRPSFIELEAAELFVSLIDSVDMVKFTKNGSTAVTAAIKLSRAYTGREIIVRCADHPFFSFDDWFIGSTPMAKGVPSGVQNQTKTFKYNDIQSLIALIDEYPNQISCVILEPATTSCPRMSDFDGTCCSSHKCPNNFCKRDDNFLNSVAEICKKNGIVFILDEMITGFRWHLKGAQYLYGVKPDLCTFGKAMANGFSVACVAGKREIMQLGSIEIPDFERTFLLSTTHGAEMNGLGAFVKTVDMIQRYDIVDHMWNYGSRMINMLREKAVKYNLERNFLVGGVACSPWYSTVDQNGMASLELRTLFQQEMLRNNVLMPWIAISWRHQQEEFDITERAVEETFQLMKLALETGIDKYLIGPAIKPVFRKYN
jgi:glutamate-1-semialdehyde 2,1-aminomutase